MLPSGYTQPEFSSLIIRSIKICLDNRFDPAAQVEIAHDLTSQRLASCDDVVEDLVGNVFVKYPLLAIGKQVEFQRLQFNDLPIGNVFDPNRAKVGLTGPGTNGRKLRTGDSNLVFSSTVLIWKCIELTHFQTPV